MKIEGVVTAMISEYPFKVPLILQLHGGIHAPFNTGARNLCALYSVGVWQITLTKTAISEVNTSPLEIFKIRQ